MDSGPSAEDRRSATELVREANHRVANHLTLLTATIQLQLDALKKGPEQVSRQAACDHLRAAIARIVAIGNLHRRLSGFAGSSIDLGQFLSETRSELLASLSAVDRTRVEERISKGCAVTAEQASIVCLVVGEVIVNALKYAHPPDVPVLIRLACRRLKRGVVVEIGDDGSGLPDGFDEERDGGVGFRLMRSLLHKIGAELDYESSPSGLKFKFTVPPEPVSS